MKRAKTRIGLAIGALGAVSLLVGHLLVADVYRAGMKEVGWTYLHNSVAHVDDPKEVERLIAGGEKVNARNASGNTPLHLVQSAAVALVLLRHGADVNARGQDGITPLHAAAEKGRVDVAAVLLGAGADVNARDNNGRTPLQYALDAVVQTVRRKEMAQLLRRYGGKP